MADKDNTEDDYKEENFDNSASQDDEDFGLPDLDEDFNADDTSDEIIIEETVEEEIITFDEEEEPASTIDTSDQFVFESEIEEDSSDSDVYEAESEAEEDEVEPVATYVPPKESSAPIIIVSIIILLAIGFAVWFFFLKDSKKQDAVANTPVKDTTTYVVEKPIAVAEPVMEEPENTEPEVGTINTLNGRTGRSYVVVGSFFDDDMAMDYAKELKKKGTSAYIIPPFGKSKFTRVAVAEAGTFAEASSSATALAGQFKEQPWPLKY